MDGNESDTASQKEKKLPKLPPCRICGEPATGFHYGVNSCGACKGFFLRSLARREPYACLGNGQCNIGLATKRRKSCQKCRFDKCLRLGMSKEAIKIGRYTYSKRTQDTLELNQLKSGTTREVNETENFIRNGSSVSVEDGLSQGGWDSSAETQNSTDSVYRANALHNADNEYRTDTQHNKNIGSNSISYPPQAAYTPHPGSRMMNTELNRQSAHDISLHIDMGSADIPNYGEPLTGHHQVSGHHPFNRFSSSKTTIDSTAAHHRLDFSSMDEGPKDNMPILHALTEKLPSHDSLTIQDDLSCSGRPPLTTVQDYFPQNAHASNHTHTFPPHYPNGYIDTTTNAAVEHHRNNSFHPLTAHATSYTHHSHPSSITNTVENGVLDLTSSHGHETPTHDGLLPLSKVLSESIAGQDGINDHSASSGNSHFGLDGNSSMPDHTLFIVFRGVSPTKRIPMPPSLREKINESSISILDLDSHRLVRLLKQYLSFTKTYSGDVELLINQLQDYGINYSDVSLEFGIPLEPSNNFMRNAQTDHLSKTIPKDGIKLGECISKCGFDSGFLPLPSGEGSEGNGSRLCRSIDSKNSNVENDPDSGFSEACSPDKDNWSDVVGIDKVDSRIYKHPGISPEVCRSIKCQGQSSSSSALIKALMPDTSSILTSDSQVQPLPPSVHRPGCQIWSNDFTEAELDDWITGLVTYHTENLVDNNTVDQQRVTAESYHVRNQHQLEETTFGTLPPLDREQYFDVYRSTGLDVDGRGRLMSTFLRGIHSELNSAIKFFKRIPGFKSLPMTDQITLVKGSSHEFHILSMFRGWDNDTRAMTFVPLGTTLSETDLRKMFPPEALERHINMMNLLQKLDLTLEQVVIFKALVAVTPDREELEAADDAMRIYWKLTNCLLLLLWRQTPQPLQKFSKIIDLLTEMRTYSMALRASYTTIREDIEVLTEKTSIPYIFELFF